MSDMAFTECSHVHTYYDISNEIGDDDSLSIRLFSV